MGKGGGLIDRAVAAVRPMGNSLSSQMAALEAAARDRDEDSQSPAESNGNKGKGDKKQKDIKHEMDDDSSMLDSNSGGGKNVSNDMLSNIKTEMKSEPMDTDAGGSGLPDQILQIKSEIKEEPMSPSADQKPDIKPVVPEPIQPNALDKKKKCCKYTACNAHQFHSRLQFYNILISTKFPQPAHSIQTGRAPTSLDAYAGQNVSSRPRIDAIPAASRSVFTQHSRLL